MAPKVTLSYVIVHLIKMQTTTMGGLLSTMGGLLNRLAPKVTLSYEIVHLIKMQTTTMGGLLSIMGGLLNRLVSKASDLVIRNCTSHPDVDNYNGWDVVYIGWVIKQTGF